ncbi:hypothetical protein Hanom_Chr03g00222231 [Helianthus anomalus]
MFQMKFLRIPITETSTSTIRVSSNKKSFSKSISWLNGIKDGKPQLSAALSNQPFVVPTREKETIKRNIIQRYRTTYIISLCLFTITTQMTSSSE